MSWEFRTFLPIQSAPILYTILDEIIEKEAASPPTSLFVRSSSSTSTSTSTSTTNNSGEQLIKQLISATLGRTDAYIILQHCDASSCGIKIRGGKNTEVKLRKGIVPNCMNACEKWKKITNISKKSFGCEEWKNDVSNFLWKKGVLPYNEVLAIEDCVSMTKTRQAYVYRLNKRKAHVSVTVDLLRCSVDGEGGVEGEVWISLSLEGGAIDVQIAMSELNIMNILNGFINNKNTGIFGGYPKFAKYFSNKKTINERKAIKEEGEEEEEEEEEVGKETKL